MKTSKLVVYIASPYTLGDVADNVAVSMEAAHTILDMGLCPISPLLSHFLHIHRRRPYDEWLEMDLELLRRSDILVRLPGESPGADKEVEEAMEQGIPVVYGMEELVEWLDET